MRLALHTHTEDNDMEITAVADGLMISIENGSGMSFVIIPTNEVLEFKRLLEIVTNEIEDAN